MMSRTNDKRHIKWHEAYKCKFRLDTRVCINKQRWNNDICRCEYKEFIAKGRCDKRFIWYLSNCEQERDKSWDDGEYLGYKNCKCRKRLAGKLVEECRKNIVGNKIIYNNTLNDYGKMYNTCTVIHSIVSQIFYNKYKHQLCFHLFSLVLKRKYIEATIF